MIAKTLFYATWAMQFAVAFRFRPTPSRRRRAQPSRGHGTRQWIAAILIVVTTIMFSGLVRAGNGNRLAYLDGGTPYYPSRIFPKLVTPQWVGERGVKAVVVLAIDDMRDPRKYEAFLRPILQRLKQIDGRADLSIMTCGVKPDDPQLQAWLDEGLSLEIHTIDHPCPLLQKGDFAKAKGTYDQCVDLLNKVRRNTPVAFRMPCCDSLNTVSPRFFAEIFNKTTPNGHFLQVDSSVFNLFTDRDSDRANGQFGKYLPRDRGFVNLIENYPYPYVIDRLCWEFPCVTPSDWEANHFHKPNNPQTVADWERAIDLTVQGKGVLNLVFHPHGWIKNTQIVELIDYTVKKHGKKVKFLSFREALNRINRTLLGGHPIRGALGKDNGVRILDVDNDGYMDVVVSNSQWRTTQIWNPKSETWKVTGFPIRLDESAGGPPAAFADFADRAAGPTTVVGRPAGEAGHRIESWDFNGWEWVPARWSNRLHLFADDSRLKFRDLDGDGCCEAIIGNSQKSAVYALTGTAEAPVWTRQKFTLPPETALVSDAGSESGLKFEDVDKDGDLDVLFSNSDRYSLHLFESLAKGWSTRVFSDRRGSRPANEELPMFVRADGTNNGAWFRDGELLVQNEDSAKLKGLVDRRTFDDWLKDVSVGPLSPEDSLRTIRLHRGFKVELVAAEPLVIDPVAFEWGADGKLWVVEMIDYPRGIDGKGAPGGRLKFLEDTDGDGRYDKATVFLDKLNFPNGVLPWGKGVLVSSAPQILYAADTDGDGHANTRDVLYQGFREGNQQHRVNGLVRGLDNWIYCANGDSGGTITSIKTGRHHSLGRRDFRILPQTGALETEFGSTQFLRSRDDWGDWFGNNNSDPMWQYVLEERYTSRNLLAFAVDPRHDVSVAPGAAPCYPISRTLKRFNDFSRANHFTSACSTIVYGNDLFGPEFEGNSFVSEPVHNLVHREVMSRNGILYTSHRADDEQKSEFLASRDNWFRPTMLKVGPDGALYLADMYRQVIEHPEYIPAQIQKELDLRAGSDRGRIYRVSPEGKTLRRVPKLDGFNTLQLVQALDSRNAWQRETAQQLLIERRDPVAVKLLMSLAIQGKLPQGRLHALCALDGLEALPADVLLQALADPHWGVRKNAVRLAERFSGKSPQVEEAVLRCVDDVEGPVQLQVACTLGELHNDRASEALSRLARKHGDDSYFVTAVMSSVGKDNIERMLAEILSDSRTDLPEPLTTRLLNATVLLKNDRALATAILSVAHPESLPEKRARLFIRLAAITQSLGRLGKSLDRLQGTADPNLHRAIEQLNEVLADAREQVQDPNATDAVRVAAIKVLALRDRDVDRDMSILAGTLVPQSSAAVQIAAVNRLGELTNETIPNLLLKGWKSHPPVVRDRIIETLLRRRYWTRVLLDAIEKRFVSALEIDAVHWQALLESRERSQQTRAKKLLAGSLDPNRQQVIVRFQPALKMSGDANRGKPLFVKHCATCHKLGGEGQNVGPDLASRKDKSAESLLIAVLDPNRNVESKYIAYVAVTAEGRTYNGILVDESTNGLVLVGSKGERVELLRSQIEELSSTSRSLMPDGLEKDLSPQILSDIVAYVQKFDAVAHAR